MILENQYIYDDIAQVIGNLKRPNKKKQRKRNVSFCLERFIHGRFLFHYNDSINCVCNYFYKNIRSSWQLSFFVCCGICAYVVDGQIRMIDFLSQTIICFYLIDCGTITKLSFVTF